jgi:hypothetical protein
MDKQYYAIGFIIVVGITVIWYYLNIIIKDEDRVISFGRRRGKITINLDDHFNRPWSTVLMLGFGTIILVVLFIMFRLIYSTI